jgi:D-3-phosphoglycerate dehydrogenase / 2-oxoglutarate reductase
VSGRIFVAASTFAEHDRAPLEMLRSSAFEIVMNPHGRRLTRDEVIALGAGAAGIIAGVEPYDETVLSALTGLRCISRIGVGVDNIALPAAQARGIAVRNTPDVVIAPVAELTVAMILDLLKRVTEHTVLLRAGRWEKLTGRMLAGKTVGLLGLGRIGRRVAELLVPFGAAVIGCDPRGDRAWADATRIRLVAMDELLGTSDVLSLHLTVTSDSPFRLDAVTIDRMKRGAYLVNVARGKLVDEAALFDALRDGRLAGAALDVFDVEPYSGPLAQLPQVLLTPHVATLTLESRSEMERQAARNVLDVLTR